MKRWDAEITISFEVEADSREEALEEAERLAEKTAVLDPSLSVNDLDVQAAVALDPREDDVRDQAYERHAGK